MPSFNITKTAVDSKISVSRNPALIRDWKPICSIWLTRKWENMKKQKKCSFHERIENRKDSYDFKNIQSWKNYLFIDDVFSHWATYIEYWINIKNKNSRCFWYWIEK